jgi:allophanate hydrolase subunit 1
MPAFNEHQDNVRSEARAHARDEIALRIRRVCGSLSDGEFEALVDKMAGVQVKYDQANTHPASLHQVLKFLSERTTPTDLQRKVV